MRGPVSAVLVTALLVAGSAFAQTKHGRNNGIEQLSLFDEAFEWIRHDAVDSVSSRRLIGAAITGMLSGLDEHSGYLDRATLRAARGAGGGGEVGIGAAVSLDQGQLKVISPRDGSPAAAAGIKPGDLIFAIDKEPTYELTLAEAEQKLRGPAGSTVALSVQRGEGGAPLKLAVKRAAGHLATVTARLEDGNIGYLRLAGFDAGTQAALAAALQDLRQHTAGKLAGLVLDLRNNPGGNFQDAVAAADAFLDQGDIALVKGRKPDSLKHIAATPGDLARGLPIVALVNGGTADQAELVAGALQDNHRAILLGTKTYGESDIETLIPLASGGAVRLTTARFLTPTGRPIQGKGLEPDLVVTALKLDRLTQGDNWLHEADLPGALKNPDLLVPSDATKVSDATHGSISAMRRAGSAVDRDIGAPGDEQLSEALDVLHGLAVIADR
jgi:carboxyl-terminal processing protease